jgi:hypothetical protein
MSYNTAAVMKCDMEGHLPLNTEGRCTRCYQQLGPDLAKQAWDAKRKSDPSTLR